MAVSTGVDCSQYQGTINWDELAQSVSFVIYRGTSAQGGLHVDADFLENHAQARSHNIPHGIYHFAGGTDATAEATYFYQQCATNLIPGEVVILDAEWNLATNPVWCLEFLQTLEGLVGFKPMIYMNHSLMMTQDWSAVSGGDYGLWLADWDGDPNVVVSMHDWTFCAIQQYTDSGNIGGLVGVDIDAFFAASLDVWNSYGKPVPPAPTVLQPPVVVAPVPTPIPVQSPVVVNDPLPPKKTPVPVKGAPAPTVSKPFVSIEDEVAFWYEKYAKGVVAFITTALAGLATWSVLIPTADQHWVQFVIGVLGTAGVIAIPNKK